MRIVQVRLRTMVLSVVFSLTLMATALVSNSNAVIYVSDYGETGWQTFSETFVYDWSGTVGIGVSNEGDMWQDPLLLIDNMVIAGPAGNRGFELGDFTGYTVFGTAVTVGTDFYSWYGGTLYTPTEGGSMAMLSPAVSINEPSVSSFLNSTLEPGTSGAYITFSMDVLAGETVSFDWNFLAFDQAPYGDFAFLFAQNPTGGMDHYEVLAEIAPSTPSAVPEPSTFLLLGAGMAGFGYVKRRMLWTKA